MLLEDEELEQEIIALIKDKQMTADAAANEIIEGQATALEELDDEYLKERAADVRDIGKAPAAQHPRPGYHRSERDSGRSDSGCRRSDSVGNRTAEPEQGAGLHYRRRWPYPPTPLSWRVPLNCQPSWAPVASTTQVKNGDYLVLDAVNNQVLVNPTNEQIEELRKLQIQVAEEKAELAKLKRSAGDYAGRTSG